MLCRETGRLTDCRRVPARCHSFRTNLRSQFSIHLSRLIKIADEYNLLWCGSPGSNIYGLALVPDGTGKAMGWHCISEEFIDSPKAVRMHG